MIKKQFDELFYKYKPVQNYNEMWNFINEVLLPINPKIIMEIGTEFGGSSIIWATICAEAICAENEKPVFIGIDTRTEQAQEVIINSGLKKNFCLVDFWFEGKSQDKQILIDVADWVYKESVDFLFIDGSHIPNDVYLDCKNYIPFIRKGGIVAFHDAGDPRGPILGINKAKQEGIINPQNEGLYNEQMGIYWFKKG